MWQSSNRTLKASKGNGKLSDKEIKDFVDETLEETKKMELSLSNDSVRLDRLIAEIKQNTRPPSL